MADVGGFVGEGGRRVKPRDRAYVDARSRSLACCSGVRAGGHGGSDVTLDILRNCRVWQTVSLRG